MSAFDGVGLRHLYLPLKEIGGLGKSVAHWKPGLAGTRIPQILNFDIGNTSTDLIAVGRKLPLGAGGATINLKNAIGGSKSPRIHHP